MYMHAAPHLVHLYNLHIKHLQLTISTQLQCHCNVGCEELLLVRSVPAARVRLYQALEGMCAL